MSRRVVITGLGTINPLGNNVHEFWEGVKSNKLGIDRIKEFETDDIGVSVAGIVKGFEPTDFIEKKSEKNGTVYTFCGSGFRRGSQGLRIGFQGYRSLQSRSNNRLRHRRNRAYSQRI